MIKILIKFLYTINILKPITIARLKYFYKFHKYPNFEHPTNLSEKINWLKFYSDTSLWGNLADKFKVREYVKSQGLEHILTKLYGKWNSVNDINWEILPNQFVMKANHRSGVNICYDKSVININEWKKKFQKQIKSTYGIVNGEFHYLQITPCIIAEELLNISSQPLNSQSLVDYKILCFNGKPHHILVCYNRNHGKAKKGIYDINWQYRSDYIKENSNYSKTDIGMPKPSKLNEMLLIASKLSENIPFVRVDLYEVDQKVYFGEMTFTPYGGFLNSYTNKTSIELGNLLDLNKAKIK